MADGLMTLLQPYIPDIAKALTACVMGLSIYVWNQREKSIDAIELDLKNDREVNEDRIKAVYKKIEEVADKVTAVDKELAVVVTRQSDCERCP